MKVKKKTIIELDDEENLALMVADGTIGVLMEDYKINCETFDSCKECPIRSLCKRVNAFQGGDPYEEESV